MPLLNIQQVKKSVSKSVERPAGRSIEEYHVFQQKKANNVAIMGESGSGKSTLLNLMATLDQPTAGELALNGIDLTTIKEKDAASFRRDHLGFVFKISIYWILFLSKTISYYHQSYRKCRSNKWTNDCNHQCEHWELPTCYNTIPMNYPAARNNGQLSHARLSQSRISYQQMNQLGRQIQKLPINC